MGMFDSLYVKCPKCRNKLEFQSKSWVCGLYGFTKKNLSPEVAMGMDGDILRCQFCNKRIRLKCNLPKVMKFKLVITKGKKFDYEGNYNPKHPYSIKRSKKLAKMLKIATIVSPRTSKELVKEKDKSKNLRGSKA